MKSSKNISSKIKKPAKKRNDVQKAGLHIFLGDVMTSSFFNNNKFTILIIVCLLMFYITIKYECQTRMETISKLEKELAIVKSESIREQSTFMSRTRESMMTHLVDSMHLNLKVQDQPPFKLKYDEK